MSSSILPYLCLLITSFSPVLLLAHQSISFPTPISRDVACRISSNANCPGPCPTRSLRYDQTPNNPAITVKRGGVITINTLSNTHNGGFARWSLVHVRDMYNKYRHRQGAFLYTCADLARTKCSLRNLRRDCPFDRRGVHYRNKLKIPSIYADGVYVLGWVWYGGGSKFGRFGDYYDCMYIKVQGGPFKNSHKPVFKAGPSATGRGDKCAASVNRIGICWREPCPGGGFYSSMYRPYEFSDGRSPSPISRSMFKYPYKIRRRHSSSPFVRSITIRSADNPKRIFASSPRNRFAYMRLKKSMRPTVTCEVGGKVRHVTFFINGHIGRTDYHSPYSIAGDRRYRGSLVFSPWNLQVEQKVITIACRATGLDGIEHWRNMELSTYFKK